MIRITGGIFKGRPLKFPKSTKVRPTSSKVREAIFDMLGPRVVGAQVLDLYAGSGLLGLEALSRGAKRVFFVEQDRLVCKTLRDNLAALAAGQTHPILCNPAHRAIRQLSQSGLDFGIVLLDPPYDLEAHSILQTLARANIVRPGGWIILERSRHAPSHAQPGLVEVKTKTYGYTRVIILKPAPGEGKGEENYD